MINLFLVIKQDAKKKKNECRVLILGCGEAGKSTFIKQMQIIRKGGFSDDFNSQMNLKKTDMKDVIAHNVMEAISTLTENLTFEEEQKLRNDPSLASAYDSVLTLEEHNEEIRLKKWNRGPVHQIAEDIKMLWDSELIQGVFARRNLFQLIGMRSERLLHDLIQLTLVPSHF